MFEVMTLVTCDGPQVAGLGEADDAGSEAAVAVAPHRHSAGLYHQDPGLTPARPGVHSADINEPAAKDPVGIVGILRFFFGVRRWCACDVQHHGHRQPARTRQASSLGLSSPPGQSPCPGVPPERASHKP